MEDGGAEETKNGSWEKRERRGTEGPKRGREEERKGRGALRPKIRGAESRISSKNHYLEQKDLSTTLLIHSF